MRHFVRLLPKRGNEAYLAGRGVSICAARQP